jgi:hypothetical protein
MAGSIQAVFPAMGFRVLMRPVKLSRPEHGKREPQKGLFPAAGSSRRSSRSERRRITG